jgi:hypothetical protein
MERHYGTIICRDQRLAWTTTQTRWGTFWQWLTLALLAAMLFAGGFSYRAWLDHYDFAWQLNHDPNRAQVLKDWGQTPLHPGWQQPVPIPDDPAPPVKRLLLPPTNSWGSAP